jgi:hypothetical protein
MSRHMLAHFHWCAGCWEMGVPLSTLRRTARLSTTRPAGNRIHLEGRRPPVLPVAPAVYRQLLAVNPMYLFLTARIMKTGIRSAYVRTEVKRAVMMAGMVEMFIERTS